MVIEQNAREYTVKYMAGGYPIPTYTGQVKVIAFNSNSALMKADLQVKRELMLRPTKLSIIEVSI